MEKKQVYAIGQQKNGHMYWLKRTTHYDWVDTFAPEDDFYFLDLRLDDVYETADEAREVIRKLNKKINYSDKVGFGGKGPTFAAADWKVYTVDMILDYKEA